jgi:SAM-dependent methyltransferase
MSETPVCNICGSSRNQVIIENVQNKNTNLVECICGLRFFSPRPSLDELKLQWATPEFQNVLRKESISLFETGLFFGAEPNKDYTSEINGVKSYYRLIYDKILRIGKQNPTSILEVGCSIGRFLDICREKMPVDNRVLSLYGIDINPFAAQIARERLNLYVVYGDFAEHAYTDKLDWIVMLDYIEHSYRPREDIEKAYALLNDGGLLVLKTFLEDLDPNHVMMLPPCHAYHFYGDVLYKLLRENGFRILCWEVEFDNQQVFVIARKT